MVRRSAKTLEKEAPEVLLDALASLGLDARPATDEERGQAGTDSLVVVANIVVVADPRTIVTGGGAPQLVREVKRTKRPTVVVAERIAEDAKAVMRKAGVNYLDRRGQLRIVQPPLIVDTDVPPSVGGPTISSDVLSSQVAKEVAIACLLTPDQAHGVREVAVFIDRVPSAVSRAMAGLREVGLLTSRGEPAIPDLFHELSVRWRRQPAALANLPRPGRGKMNAQLELGLDEPETTSGWALTDTLGAAGWGMPVVARGDYPPDFYVPTNAVLRRARALLREAPDQGPRACTVAVAPVRMVCLRRHNVDSEVWPVANHIVVALDIATDRARGSEILEQWHPEEIVRAW